MENSTIALIVVIALLVIALIVAIVVSLTKKDVPQDCLLGEWSQLGDACGFDGTGYSTTFTRKVLKQAQNGGAACDALEKKVPCSPVDCSMSEWSPCSAQNTQTRSVLVQPARGGKPCGALQQDCVCQPDCSKYKCNQKNNCGQFCGCSIGMTCNAGGECRPFQRGESELFAGYQSFENMLLIGNIIGQQRWRFRDFLDDKGQLTELGKQRFPNFDAAIQTIQNEIKNYIQDARNNPKVGGLNAMSWNYGEMLIQMIEKSKELDLVPHEIKDPALQDTAALIKYEK
jgi:hypothetical protein